MSTLLRGKYAPSIRPCYGRQSFRTPGSKQTACAHRCRKMAIGLQHYFDCLTYNKAPQCTDHIRHNFSWLPSGWHETQSSIHSPLAALFSALFISTRFRHNRPYYGYSDDGTSTNIIPWWHPIKSLVREKEAGKGEGGLIDAVTNAWRNSPEITTQGVSDFCTQPVQC